MGAVRSLCEKGVVLHAGSVAFSGDIGESIETYHKLVATNTDRDGAITGTPRGLGLSNIALETHSGATIQQADSVEVSVVVHMPREVAGFTLMCVLDDMNQRRVFVLRRDSSEFKIRGPWKGAYKITVKLPALWLEPGLYSLYFKAMFQGESAGHRHVSDVFHLDVAGKSCGWGSVLSPEMHWNLQEVGPAQPTEVAVV